MSRIELDELSACAPDGTAAVLHEISLAVEDGELLTVARPVRVGQDHAAAGADRAGRHPRRHAAAGRRGRHRLGPGRAGHGDGVPGPRAVPAPAGPGQPRAAAAAGRAARGRGGRAGPGGGRAAAADRAPGPLAEPALRRAAAAGRARAGAGPAGAGRVPAGRAAVGRPGAARPAAGDGQPAPRRSGSPRTWPRRPRSATGSRCSGTAGWPSSARPQELAERPASLDVGRAGPAERAARLDRGRRRCGCRSARCRPTGRTGTRCWSGSGRPTCARTATGCGSRCWPATTTRSSRTGASGCGTRRWPGRPSRTRRSRRSCWPGSTRPAAGPCPSVVDPARVLLFDPETGAAL